MASNPHTLSTRPTPRLVGLTAAAMISLGGVVGFTAVDGRAADDRPPAVATTSTPTAPVGAAPLPSRPAYLVIQDEIDRAIAERRSTMTTVAEATTTTTDRQQGFAPVTPDTTTPRPAYLVIQDEIDRALAEREHPEQSDG